MRVGFPVSMERVLEVGTLCYAAASTERGPHCTPLVFALSDGRIWLTTSRGSVKARAWHEDPRVGGLVRAGDLAVSFAGEVRTYDVLDPNTWMASIRHAPSLARASVRFSVKNARFFAGYAVDAKQVPLAWTPPGRVFVEIRPYRAALLDGGRVVETWGGWGRRVESHRSFRASRRDAADPLDALPNPVRDRVHGGDGALAVQAPAGPIVAPARWGVDHGVVYAAVPAQVLGLGSVPADGPVALTADRASFWRAKHMMGAMIQGEGAMHDLQRLGSGSRSATSIIQELGGDPEGASLARVKPRRLVWWKGWDSGTVSVG